MRHEVLKLKTLAKRVDEMLHDIYAGSPSLEVEDYIFIANSDDSQALAETLALEHDNTFHISIRFSKDLLNYFQENACPSDRLTSNNLGLLAVVSEEISHFQCMCRAAETETPVSRFDLELQAEFDKFLLASTLLNRQVGHEHPIQLARLLFDSSEIYQEPELYHRANNTAASWWWSQINQYGERLFQLRPDLISELKRLRHIHGEAKLATLSELKPKHFRRSA